MKWFKKLFLKKKVSDTTSEQVAAHDRHHLSVQGDSLDNPSGDFYEDLRQAFEASEWSGATWGLISSDDDEIMQFGITRNGYNVAIIDCDEEWEPVSVVISTLRTTAEIASIYALVCGAAVVYGIPAPVLGFILTSSDGKDFTGEKADKMGMLEKIKYPTGDSSKKAISKADTDSDQLQMLKDLPDEPEGGWN